jgi:hypothetical protein
MVQTAEEFLRQKPFINGMTWYDQQIAMIEFAKLHVEAALKEASEKAEIHTEVISGDLFLDLEVINKDSILNSYPPENIK